MRLPHGADVPANIPVRIGILLLELPRNRRHFRARLLERHTRLQPAHHVNKCGVALFEAFTWERLRLHQHRHEIFSGDPDNRSAKTARSDSNYGERMLVDLNGSADDFGVGAETAAPEAVTQHDVWIGVRAARVVCMKRAATRCIHAEQIEIIFSDDQSPIALRLQFFVEF